MIIIKFIVINIQIFVKIDIKLQVFEISYLGSAGGGCGLRETSAKPHLVWIETGPLYPYSLVLRGRD